MVPITQRQSEGLQKIRPPSWWSLSAHLHCGFRLGLVNANEHAEQTVSGGGAHAQCVCSGSILLQADLLVTLWYPEGSLREAGREGRKYQCQGGRGSYRGCSWHEHHAPHMILSDHVTQQSPGLRGRCPDWLAVNSAAQGLGFVCTQLLLSGVEGPSSDSRPLVPCYLYGSRRWMT